jgi:hypothetical protein
LFAKWQKSDREKVQYAMSKHIAAEKRERRLFSASAARAQKLQPGWRKKERAKI